MKRYKVTIAAGLLAPALIWAQSADLKETIKDLSDRAWRYVEKTVSDMPVVKDFTPHSLEEMSADENSESMAIAKMMFQAQMIFYAGEIQQAITGGKPLTEAISRRDAHAKGHGCAAGQFRVSEDLPEFLKTPVFTPGKEYSTTVRFSNGSSRVLPDGKPDGRGMAVKLKSAMNEGENFLEQSTEQDFMMINASRFFIRNIEDYKKFQMATLKGIEARETDVAKVIGPFLLERLIREKLPEIGDAEVARLVPAVGKAVAESRDANGQIDQAKLMQNLAALNLPQDQTMRIARGLGAMAAKKAPVELQVIDEINSQPARNPLYYPFYSSMSPYLLHNQNGEEYAVKYRAEPVNCADRQKIADGEKLPQGQSMRDSIFKSLSQAEVCYDFSVDVLELNSDEQQKKKIIEDATYSWAGISKTYKVAEITLNRVQDIAELDAGCEDISYNPWRSQVSHRPLGGINRVRRFAVTGSFLRRSFINNETRQRTQESK